MISDFAKEKVFWTRKMNLKLVKFIESRPNIWNPKHPKYTSVAIRDRTYAEFASKYGNDFTWQAVKDRWTNIRSTFANYLRKLNASRTRDDSEEYKVNWHLWDACHFLLKVNRKNIKALSISESNNEENWMDDNPYELNEVQDIEDNCVTTNLNCTNVMQDLVTVFQNIQNDANDQHNIKYSKIGKMVCKKLTELNSYEAARMSNTITGILLLYDENNPNNPNNIKSETTYHAV